MDEPSTYVALQVALSKVARLTVENERLKLLLKYANEVIEEKQPVVHSND